MNRVRIRFNSLPILMALIGLAPLWHPVLAKAEDRPNIVVIIADDQGFPHFGFMRDHVSDQEAAELKIPADLDWSKLTPTLDSLAATGTFFPVAHNVGSICRPSLAGLMSGRYISDMEKAGGDPAPDPNGDGITDLIAGFLAEAGYRSYGIGKNWAGDWGEQGFTDGYPEFRYAKDITRETRQPIFDFINEAVAVDAPFLVWYAPYLPHAPHNAPEDYRALFDDVSTTGSNKAYYAMVRWFDDTVGEIVDFLDDNGLRDNTLLFVISDNGARLPTAKGRFTENGYRTPLLINGPGVAPGKSRREMVHSVDVLPTVLNYAGIPHLQTEAMRGLDLTPLLRNTSVPWRRYLFGLKATNNGGMPVNNQDRYVRDMRGYKLYRSGSGKLSLYDLIEDPAEQQELDLTAHGELVDTMLAALEEWEAGSESFTASPRKSTVRMATADARTFSVELEGLLGAPLTYAWTLDDNLVGDAADFVYAPGVDGTGPHELKVQADGADGSVEYSWTVNVDAQLSPNLDVAPTSPVTVEAERSRVFRIAFDPARSQTEYSWSLDGAPVGDDSTFTWTPVPEDEGANHLQATITDSSGTSATYDWTVNVSAPPEPPDASDGLVAHWSFEDQLMPTRDETGQGHDGTLLNTAHVIPNPQDPDSGSVLSTDGNNDFMTIPGYKGIVGDGPRSVLAWVLPRRDQGGIVQWGTMAESGGRWAVYLYRGRLRLNIRSSNVTGTTSLMDGHWHHVAVVLPDAGLTVGDARLYVDGELETHDTDSRLVDTGDETDTCVGCGLPYDWSGELDDVRIYDRAITEREIFEIFDEF